MVVSTTSMAANGISDCHVNQGQRLFLFTDRFLPNLQWCIYDFASQLSRSLAEVHNGISVDTSQLGHLCVSLGCPIQQICPSGSRHRPSRSLHLVHTRTRSGPVFLKLSNYIQCLVSVLASATSSPDYCDHDQDNGIQSIR